MRENTDRKLCGLCGDIHTTWQAHKFPDTIGKPASPKKRAKKKPTRKKK